MNYTDNISINTRIVDNSIGVPHHHDQARKTSTESQLNTRSTSFDSNSPAQFADNSSAESSSTRLVSPISNSSDTFNMLSGQFPSVFGNSVNPAYGYSTQQPSSSGSNASFNYPFYPNQSTGTDYTGGTGQGYTSDQQSEFNFDGSSAAIMEAARGMFGNIDFANLASLQSQFIPPAHSAAISTHTLFQSGNQDTTLNTKRSSRSPSPLYEIDEESSPEMTEIIATRRNTFSASESPLDLDIPRRSSAGAKFGRRLSISALDPEEKAMRAALADGLSKPDKRRMQNKLAQRAFRARNKVTNKQAAGRLDELEVLTEQQADRIDKLNELVLRLQRENQGLKTQKFHEAMSMRPA